MHKFKPQDYHEHAGFFLMKYIDWTPTHDKGQPVFRNIKLTYERYTLTAAERLSTCRRKTLTVIFSAFLFTTVVEITVNLLLKQN